MITLEKARAEVKRIYTMTEDSESAHVAEKNLWHDVLEAISKGSPDARRLALVALKTREINFHRWFA